MKRIVISTLSIFILSTAAFAQNPKIQGKYIVKRMECVKGKFSEGSEEDAGAHMKALNEMLKKFHPALSVKGSAYTEDERFYWMFLFPSVHGTKCRLSQSGKLVEEEDGSLTRTPTKLSFAKECSVKGRINLCTDISLVMAAIHDEPTSVKDAKAQCTKMFGKAREAKIKRPLPGEPESYIQEGDGFRVILPDDSACVDENGAALTDGIQIVYEKAIELPAPKKAPAKKPASKAKLKKKK